VSGLDGWLGWLTVPVVSDACSVSGAGLLSLWGCCSSVSRLLPLSVAFARGRAGYFLTQMPRVSTFICCNTRHCVAENSTSPRGHGASA
jgi:hypothetical protein